MHDDMILNVVIGDELSNEVIYDDDDESSRQRLPSLQR